MQLDDRLVGGVVILKVTGDITLKKGGDLQEKVRDLLGRGHNRLLVELSAVSYVDSFGLGQLVQVYSLAKNQGGALKLLNVTKRLLDMLVVTMLSTVFEVYDDGPGNRKLRPRTA